MSVTDSDCSVPGGDPFHISAVGDTVTCEFEITLTDYDAANLRYTGRQVGQVVAPNVPTNEDNPASMQYDTNEGMWFLVATWIERVPIEAC